MKYVFAIAAAVLLFGSHTFAETRAECANSCNSTFGTGDSVGGRDCLSKCASIPEQQPVQASGPSCMDRLQQLVNACQTASDTARNSCDESQNTGMAQAQQAAVVLGQQVSTSVQAACSSMGKISQAANAATAAYQMNCASDVNSCNSTCDQALQFYNQQGGCIVGPPLPGQRSMAGAPTEINDLKKVCSDLRKKADTAQQAVNNFLTTTLQAQNCANDSSGTSAAVTPELCAANPNLAGCTAAGTVDCTKPELANTNKVCICAKSPNDPQCMSGQSAGNSTSLASTGSISGSRTASNSDLGTDGDMFGLPQIDQAPVNRTPGDAIEGKQGAGAPLGSDGGGSGSGGAGGRGGGGGKSTDPIQVTAGFYSGGGGGGGWGGGSGGAGEKNPQGMGGLAAKAGVPGGPNLRQFLPGGTFDPRRGVAGASGPDGITGPNSNIWMKIQNRYQVVGPSLMP
ncbi:hypothetical protein [Bdellovibrio sp. NC01]|uniref:hypothetical protein n=1 Tax=Bdellovibrio sp. NC01 TaxID=2220073 RepID=UPI00143CD16D|nr:hypothetical protein [Bdellovibrio sp. NC01]